MPDSDGWLTDQERLDLLKGDLVGIADTYTPEIQALWDALTVEQQLHVTRKSESDFHMTIKFDVWAHENGYEEDPKDWVTIDIANPAHVALLTGILEGKEPDARETTNQLMKELPAIQETWNKMFPK